MVHVVVVAALGVSAPVLAQAQWKVVFLEPPGVRASEVFAAGGSIQGGRVEMPNGNYHPALWQGTAESFGDLMAPGFYTGWVYGTDGSAQVGVLASTTIGGRGVLWHGSPAYVDLSPDGQYGLTQVHAVCGDQQVGTADHMPSGSTHSGCWRGNRASFIDLHPSVCQWSEAFATDGVRQGGWGKFPTKNNQFHAILWHGTAASFVDMNPAGARASRIRGMADGVQVGWGLFGTVEHGVVWHGTPQSAIVMDPPGDEASRIYATTGKIHAGYTSYTGWGEAGIWTSDDEDSFLNLHLLLGPGWYASAAYAVSQNEGRIYVAGTAAKVGEREQAVLWIGRLAKTAPQDLLRAPKPPPKVAPE